MARGLTKAQIVERFERLERAVDAIADGTVAEAEDPAPAVDPDLGRRPMPVDWIGSSPSEVEELLDSLSHDQRLRALSRLTRREQRRLYELAAGAPPLGLDFFVPPGTPAGNQVIHHGTNTLPVPRRLRRFQKRFARPEGEGDRLFGYNEGLPWRLLGPGYFVAEPTAGNPDWGERGAVVVDYFQVPDGGVPPGWPRVVPNSRGLQRFIYRGTRDFMRRLSGDVSIGAAFRGEKPLDHYFTLCRASPAR